MDKKYSFLIDAVKRELNQNKATTLAIDGPCACGKTSLAKMLKEEFDARIVPMDDFFLPQELRTQERYLTPGGNVHYERFLTEIAPCIKGNNHLDIFYNRFDCKSMNFSQPIFLPYKPLTIIEGTYSLHQTLRSLYSIKVLLTIDPVEQKRRLLQRESKESFKVFMDKWIPLETLYFKNEDLSKFCDVIL
ncbi:MAG: uridine kinase [Clostridia bacterium]|nr:uridine kinase [Clostridia bacterium]